MSRNRLPFILIVQPQPPYGEDSAIEYLCAYVLSSANRLRANISGLIFRIRAGEGPLKLRVLSINLYGLPIVIVVH